MEILIREPGPQAEFTHLLPGMPVELEPGNVFRSYGADNLQAPQVEVRVVADPMEIPAAWIGLFLAAVLGGIGVWGYRRGGDQQSPEPGVERAGRSRSDLLLAIARLDEAHHALQEPTEEEEGDYRSKRAILLSELKRQG
jgi:hypothetical protein